MPVYVGEPFCSKEDIYFSDSDDEDTYYYGLDYDSDDDDVTAMYKFADENPLLSSILKCRIVDIEPKDPPRAATPKFEKTDSEIEQLKLKLSIADSEISYLVQNNLEKQKQIDFLHSALEPKSPTVGLGGYFSSARAHETSPLSPISSQEKDSQYQQEEVLPPSAAFMAATSGDPGYSSKCGTVQLEACGFPEPAGFAKISTGRVKPDHPCQDGNDGPSNRITAGGIESIWQWFGEQDYLKRFP